MITEPFAYTRRYFEKEQVIISSCNYCFSAVAESNDEAELEAMEKHHSCNQKAKIPGTALRRQAIRHEPLGRQAVARR